VSLDVRLAQAIARHELDVEFVPVPSSTGSLRARVAWPQPDGGSVEHAELMLLAERCGLRRELQAWLLQAAACHLALRTRAGTGVEVVIEARRDDFGRFDVEAASVRWGIDPDLLRLQYARQYSGGTRAA
jgi:EAL domain-containing protein (putative c-di-GMP-specific phosphodiesterase class I)